MEIYDYDEEENNEFTNRLRPYFILIKQFLLNNRKILDEQGNESHTDKLNGGIFHGLESFFNVGGRGLNSSAITGGGGISRLILPPVELDNDYVMRIGISEDTIRSFDEEGRPNYLPVLYEIEDLQEDADDNKLNPEEELLLSIISDSCHTDDSFNKIKDIYNKLARGLSINNVVITEKNI